MQPVVEVASENVSIQFGLFEKNGKYDKMI